MDANIGIKLSRLATRCAFVAYLSGSRGAHKPSHKPWRLKCWVNSGDHSGIANSYSTYLASSATSGMSSVLHSIRNWPSFSAATTASPSANLNTWWQRVG